MIGPKYQRLLKQNLVCRGGTRYSMQEVERAAMNSNALLDAGTAAGGLSALWCKTRAMSLPVEKWPIELPDTDELENVPLEE